MAKGKGKIATFLRTTGRGRHEKMTFNDLAALEGEDLEAQDITGGPAAAGATGPDGGARAEEAEEPAARSSSRGGGRRRRR